MKEINVLLGQNKITKRHTAKVESHDPLPMVLKVHISGSHRFREGPTKTVLLGNYSRAYRWPTLWPTLLSWLHTEVDQQKQMRHNWKHRTGHKTPFRVSEKVTWKLPCEILVKVPMKTKIDHCPLGSRNRTLNIEKRDHTLATLL